MKVNLFSDFQIWLETLLIEYKSKSFKSKESQQFAHIISKQHSLNSWFTESDITQMLHHLCKLLVKENIQSWLKKYPSLNSAKTNLSPVILNSNLNFSFAGVHEWLCCIITQSPFILTANENQYQLLKFFSNKLTELDSDYGQLFDIAPENRLKPERYIIYAENQNDTLVKYFSKKKSLIIEPLPTIGIITGNETRDELNLLGKDIFIHLGQSNRTLRKLFIPRGYDIKIIIEALESFAFIYQNNKYANNYDYHQSVYLMNKTPFLDNGFLIFKEDKDNQAPTGCLFYEYYTNQEEVLKILSSATYENLICNETLPVKTVKPGESHFFNLWDYPNRKDLVTFLLSK